MSSTESYRIVRAAPHHLLDVLRIMRENFYHEETMFKSLCSGGALDGDETKRIDKFFDGSITSAFASAPCLVAVSTDTERVVAANVTAISTNPKTGNFQDGLTTIFASETPAPPLAKTYIEHLTKINEEAKLFDRYPDAESACEFYAIAVDKNHRRIGLARDLLVAGINLARETGVSLVFGVFTSIYSRKSAEKAGMVSIMDIDISKCEGADGTKVFKNCEPHNIVSVMVLQLR